MKVDRKKYGDLRKKLLVDEMKTIYERDKLSRKLRTIRDDMRQWDRALMNEEEN